MSNLPKVFVYHYKTQTQIFEEFMKRIKIYQVVKSAKLDIYSVASHGSLAFRQITWLLYAKSNKTTSG